MLRQIADMIEQIETGDEPRTDIPGYDATAMRKTMLDTLRKLADDPEGVVLVPGGIMYHSEDGDDPAPLGSSEPAPTAGAAQREQRAISGDQKAGSGSAIRRTRKLGGKATRKT